MCDIKNWMDDTEMAVLIEEKDCRPLWAEYLCDCDINKLLVEFSGRRRSLAVDRSETKNECFSKVQIAFYSDGQHSCLRLPFVPRPWSSSPSPPLKVCPHFYIRLFFY